MVEFTVVLPITIVELDNTTPLPAAPTEPRYNRLVALPDVSDTLVESVVKVEFEINAELTLIDERFAPTSNVTDPLDDSIFKSVRFTANSPAAMYVLFAELVVLGRRPDTVVLFNCILVLAMWPP
jgi:hypothetical protein